MLQLVDDNPTHWLLSFSVAGCEDSIWCGREPLSYVPILKTEYTAWFDGDWIVICVIAR